MIRPLFQLSFVLLCGLLCAGCGPKASTTPTAEPAGPLALQKLEIKREADHMLVRVSLKCENRGKEPLVASAATFQLDAGGNQVPPFVRPFASRQEIAPGASGEVSVEYWMAQKELGSEIALRWNDQTLPVKSAAVFPIEQLPEGKMVVVSTPDWRVL